MLLFDFELWQLGQETRQALDWMAMVWLLMSVGVILMTIMAELVRCLGHSFPRETDHPLSCSAEVKNEWTIISRPSWYNTQLWGEVDLSTALHYFIFIIFSNVLNFAFLIYPILIPEFDHCSYICYFLECDWQKCNSWESGLQNFLNLALSVICPLHKKGGHLECANYTDITLLNVTYKVFSNILYTRLLPYIESELGHYLMGFCPRKLTINPIFVL